MTRPVDRPPHDGWRVAPIISTANPRAAAEYWRDVFGFALDRADGVFAPPGTEPEGVYAIVKRGTAWVHFQRCGSGVRRGSRAPIERDVYVYVDDVLGRGAVIVAPPTAMPYGLVEFIAEDPDGCRVAFGQFVP